MALKQFQKIPLNNSTISKPEDMIRVVNLLQDNVSTSLSALTSNTQNDSLVLTNITLTAGQVNIINHTLGRMLSSWNAMPFGQAIIWQDPGTNANPKLNNQSPEKTIWLWTSADVLINLQVS